MIKIIMGDITKLNADCIVNAANEYLKRGGGVCGAIFKACGPELDKECEKIGHCPTGSSRMTRAFNIPAKWICHAVGPIYSGSPDDSELLGNAYKSALTLAMVYNCDSIAFPAISCGIFGYPIQEACSIAFKAICDFLAKHDMEVVLCCFDKNIYDEYVKLSKEL